MNGTDSRQRTVPVTCSTRHRTIFAGSLIGARKHVGDQRHARRLDRDLSRAPPPWRRRPAASARNGRERTPAASSPASRPCPWRSRPRARRRTSRPTGRPGRRHCRSPRRRPRRAGRLVRRSPWLSSNSTPISAAMAPDADRNRLLHGAAADAQKPRGVGDGERRRGRESRIFAERVAGNKGCVAGEIDAGLGFEHAQ